MKFVKDPTALRTPRKCAVTGRGSDPVGWIDTGVVLPGWDPKVHISHAAAVEIAKTVPNPELDKLRQQLKEYGDKLEKMQRQIAAYEKLQRELDPEPIAA